MASNFYLGFLLLFLFLFWSCFIFFLLSFQSAFLLSSIYIYIFWWVCVCVYVCCCCWCCWCLFPPSYFVLFLFSKVGPVAGHRDWRDDWGVQPAKKKNNKSPVETKGQKKECTGTPIEQQVEQSRWPSIVVTAPPTTEKKNLFSIQRSIRLM